MTCRIRMEFIFATGRGRVGMLPRAKSMKGKLFQRKMCTYLPMHATQLVSGSHATNSDRREPVDNNSIKTPLILLSPCRPTPSRRAGGRQGLARSSANQC